MTKRTILIADDEAYLTLVLSYNIRKAGARVLVARNGEQLCEIAQAHRPDLIVTDYQMPVLDGLQACTRLKRTAATSTIPVLMLTERGHRLSAYELSQTNIRGLLPKPFSPRELLARMAELLGAAEPVLTRELAPRHPMEHLGGAERDQTLEVFAGKLSQSYEEVNLLFRMARFLNCVNDPLAIMEMVCHQLREVLSFRWMTLCFRDRSHVLSALAGRIISSGQLPFPAERLAPLASELIERSESDSWTEVLSPGAGELASMAESEVLVEPISHEGRAIGVLLAGNKSGQDPYIDSGETQLLDAVADFLGMFHENMSRFAEQHSQFMGTLRALTAAVDAKDPYTCGHSDRVGLLASQLAGAIGMDAKQCQMYRIAGLVHDVGKIGVPEAVLCKPGRLTPEEFDLIKLHPEIGYRIVKDIPSMEPVLPGVLHHHERWDGGGYPTGLATENIPLLARVLALADTFDAMSSSRSYRRGEPRHQVLEEIRLCSGTQFDPALVQPFVSLNFAEFDQMVQARRAKQAA